MLTSAIFTVRKFDRIVPCGRGSGLMISNSYDVTLPSRPHVGQTVTIPIEQQIGPDQADRFVLRVGDQDLAEDGGVVLVYQLDVAVLHDGQRAPLKVGRVLLALPGVDRSLLGEDVGLSEGGSCVQPPASYAQLKPVVRLAGQRSPELQQLLSQAS